MRSSFSIAGFISAMRVCELGAWPQNTIAFRFSGWSMFSFASSTPSIQRETGMPVSYISGLSLPSLPWIVAKRPLSQSMSSPQTRPQWAQEPAARP